jgi:hypothetical protein
MLRYHETASERLREHGDRRDRDGRIIVARVQRRQQQALTSMPPDATRVLRWRRDMAAPERSRFAQVAGHLLHELGYETP